MNGKIYLIPNTLGDVPPLETMPLSVKKIIEDIDIYIVENEKSARRFIKSVSSSKAQSSLRLFPLNKFTNASELPTYLEPCKQGVSIGLISDAGCPSVADPGSEIVRLAHQNNIQVVPCSLSLFINFFYFFSALFLFIYRTFSSNNVIAK